ncbi:hypothetical protein HDU98_002181 [Podochytrium sp. JEL0797]|nr:hypothetical protein HDU98_002181 [Podochytrium sp. JEL0797]
MGSAIAMLLAFRTNRSFERYSQGSQLWTNLSTQIRHSARLIWTTVTPTSAESLAEKTRIMKLLLATAVATKHALRGVDPYAFEDLNSLLPEDFVTHNTGGGVHVQLGTGIRHSTTPRLRRKESLLSDTGSSPELTLPMHVRLSKPALPIKIASEPLPHETPRASSASITTHTRPSSLSTRPRASSSPTRIPASLPRKCIGNVINAPLDILHHINAYVRLQRQSGTIAPEDATPTLNAISTAIDSVTKFEQILYFPVPASYDIHMKQVLMLYFVLLPLQLVKPMGWAMILATFIMSTTFFGTDAIAGEISDPFGNDENDLPLDYFCFKLQDDIEYIMDRQFDRGLPVNSDDEEEEEEEAGARIRQKKGVQESDRQLRKRK